jgi:azurin
MATFMTRRSKNRPRLAALFSAAALAVASAGLVRAEDAPAGTPAEAVDVPKIDVTKPASVQKYKLSRLTTAQLALVERRPEKPYATIYQVLLTHKGIDRKIRQEAADALAKIDGSDPAIALINAIGMVDPEDKGTPKELVGLLMAQKPEALAAQKEKLQSLAAEAEKPVVKQAAYAAWAVADGKPDAAWQAANGKGDLKSLLGGIPLIADAKIRGSFYEKVAPLVAKAKDDETQVAAIDAVSYIPGHETDEFAALAAVIGSDKGAKRDAAIRSLDRIPPAKFPKDQVEPLALKVIEAIQSIPVAKRTDDAGVNAVQLGKDLASALPASQGNAIRKTLRGISVQTVKIRTYREQMLYDTKYFVVEAGKPVQISLENDDAMQHNIVVTQPGTADKVAMAGANLVVPPPGGKPFVPPSADVVAASDLAQGDETIKLSFTTPKKPGEYGYVCTFPGHNVRMYGVMLVVDDIDKYDRNPRPPMDWNTKKPMPSPKNEPMGGPMEHMEH